MITRIDFLREALAAAAADAVLLNALAERGPTALDRYIAAPTAEYRYDVISSVDSGRYRLRVLSMVSQRWRSSAEVDRPIWNHWLSILEPARIKTPVGVLVISGGSTTDKPPHKVDPIVADFAVRMGAVFAELHGVPNQPLTFAGDDKPRSEDELVALTWDRYLRTGDGAWPLHLPMTKAVVRAMDTITALRAQAGCTLVTDRFIVGGASKRGWTAWLTAAVDKRVVAIVPVVIDVLNVNAQARHAYGVYGSWPAALQPYERMGIMKWIGTAQFNALLAIEDPYLYRDRITIPKLIVNATGDQFFTPDSSQFYFRGLLGEKYLRYLPNTDHSLRGEAADAIQTGMAFMDSIMNGGPRPDYSWQFDQNGAIRVHSVRRPLSVNLWQATNYTTRDFRLQTIGRAFQSSKLQSRASNTYIANVPTPVQGFTAYFVELAYETTRNGVFTVTTDVRVKPNTIPFAQKKLGISPGKRSV